MTWSISHDFAFHFGGAERVTGALSRSLPGAPVLVLAGNAATLREMNLAGGDRRLYHLTQSTYRLAAPILPALISRQPAVEGNLLASSYAFSHHLACTGRKVVYCHSPFRQAWSGVRDYQARMPPGIAQGWGMMATRLRRADRRAASTADTYVATSRAVHRRIEQFYGVSSAAIVPPPLDDQIFHPSPDDSRDDYYLWAGRIVEPYKRLELVIEAFRDDRSRRLVVAGDGRDRARLEARSPENVTFLGSVDSPTLAELYRNARALIFPSEDDFGMVPMECIATGTPVVAYGKGGALDTVAPGRSGVFFQSLTPEGVRAAVAQLEALSLDRRTVLDASNALTELQFREQVLGLLEGL